MTRVPTPTGDSPVSQLSGLGPVDPRDEIGGQTVIVSRLTGLRLRNTFGEEAVLPVVAAETLENFEQGLREAGLIGVEEVLLQFLSSPRKFRVRPMKADDAAVLSDRHGWAPSARPKALRRSKRLF